MALEVAFVVKEFIFTRYKAMKMHATRERHKWLPEWKGMSLISLLDVTVFIIHSTCIILYHISVFLQAVYAYVLQRQQQDISDWTQSIEMLHVNEQVVSTHGSLTLTRRRGELTKTFRAVLVWTFFSSIRMKPFFSTSTLPILVKRRNAQTSDLWSHKAEAATDTASYSIEWTIEADQWWKHLQLLAGLRLTFCLAFRECSKCPWYFVRFGLRTVWYFVFSCFASGCLTLCLQWRARRLRAKCPWWDGRALSCDLRDLQPAVEYGSSAVCETHRSFSHIRCIESHLPSSLDAINVICKISLGFSDIFWLFAWIFLNPKSMYIRIRGSAVAIAFCGNHWGVHCPDRICRLATPSPQGFFLAYLAVHGHSATQHCLLPMGFAIAGQPNQTIQRDQEA